MIFCAWLLLLNMFLRFIYVIEYARISFPLWLNNIPLYLYISPCLSIHLLMHIWATMNSVLWTCVYIHLFEYQFSVLLGIYMEVELLGYMVILYLTFWGAAKLFSTEMYRVPVFPHPHSSSKCFFLCKTGRIILCIIISGVVKIKCNERKYVKHFVNKRVIYTHKEILRW